MAVRAGDPADAATPADVARRHREEALAWVREDLEGRRGVWEQADAKQRRLLRGYAERIDGLPDLAAVHDLHRLSALPDDEVTEWLRYWADLDAWRQQVAGD
jgi:hypothetical protein